MDEKRYQKLEEWVSSQIEVTIHGEQDEDQGPAVQKTFYKLKPCPDHTHMRIYFDPFNFVAFPIGSSIEWIGNTFEAYDQQSKLYYRIRKGNV